MTSKITFISYPDLTLFYTEKIELYQIYLSLGRRRSGYKIKLT